MFSPKEQAPGDWIVHSPYTSIPILFIEIVKFETLPLAGPRTRLAVCFRSGSGRSSFSGPGMVFIVHLAKPAAADVGVDLGRRDLTVPEHELHRAQVSPPL